MRQSTEDGRQGTETKTGNSGREARNRRFETEYRGRETRQRRESGDMGRETRERRETGDIGRLIGTGERGQRNG